MVGAFADRDVPAPTVSVYGMRRHRWLALPERIEHDEVWSELQSLYGAGEYAAVADRGRDLIAANPLNAQLIYNVACCESMAGRAGDAIEHLRQAIAIGPRPALGDGGRGLRPGRDPRRAGLPGAAHLGSPRPGWGERRGGRERMRSPVE